MILTLPFPFIILIVFWRLCGAELVMLPPTRRPRICILIGRYLILVLSAVYCIGIFLYIADLIAP